MHMGSEKFKTKIMKDAGKTPVWNQNFIFNLDGKTEPAIHINVMDEGTVTDSVIGRLDLPLADLCKSTAEQKFQIVDPDNFKKLTGEVTIQCVSYSGTVLPNQPPKAVSPMAQQQMSPVAVVSPVAQVVYQQPQQQRVVYVQQPMQPQMVYAQQPQMVYAQQPQMVYAQPQQQYVQQPQYAQPQQYVQQPMMYMQQPPRQ